MSKVRSVNLVYYRLPTVVYIKYCNCGCVPESNLSLSHNGSFENNYFGSTLLFKSAN